MMRIAIVDPYFAVGLGYQTTGWFNALVALGEQVRAFCSCTAAFSSARHLYRRSFPSGLSREGGGEVLRLPSYILPRDMALCSGLLRRVREFQPEATLAIYPGTLFAREIIEQRNRLPGVLFTTFADNRAQRRSAFPSRSHTLKRMLIDCAFYLLKRRFHRRAIEVSDVVLMQTPDTIDYLLGRIATGRHRASLEAKCVLSPLGFDSSHINMDAEIREAERVRLGLPAGAVLMMYSGRIVPVKRYDIWVSILASAMRQVPELRAVMIGFREGEDESAKVHSAIEATGLSDRFICLPFADRPRLNALYNAADIGFWHLQPSVGIQEAMGTGSYMILADHPTMSHLLSEPATGRYFRDGDFNHAEHLVVEVARAFAARSTLATLEARRQRACLNTQAFSYQAMAVRLVAAAKDPANAIARLQFDWAGEPGFGA
jgi:glycosyltransferase involved in cell wall biosynthesis